MLVVSTESITELACLFHGLRYCIGELKIADLTTPVDRSEIKVHSHVNL